MKKILIASIVTGLFAATTAFACGNCGCSKHSNTGVKSEKKSCADCTVVDGKKVMCQKCKAKKTSCDVKKEEK